MGTTTTAYIYVINNNSRIILFKSMESAQRYLASFPPSVAGGMTIRATAVFD